MYILCDLSAAFHAANSSINVSTPELDIMLNVEQAVGVFLHVVKSCTASDTRLKLHTPRCSPFGPGNTRPSSCCQSGVVHTLYHSVRLL